MLLMETQGVFDADTTMKHSTCIFSLSLLLSSIQIFNLRDNIQGEDLINLQLSVELSRRVGSVNDSGDAGNISRPFQDMIFLVKGWSYPDEAFYGWNGGQKVLRA